jgi:hypothetical protein
MCVTFITPPILGKEIPMCARLWKYRSIRWAIALMAITIMGSLAAPMAMANDLDKLDNSLKLIPEDAAVYSATLRGREQYEILRKSNVWAKVEQMPVVQMGLAMVQAQLNTPGSKLANAKAALENPEASKVLDLVAEMVSDEVFVYGDDSCTEFVGLFQNVAGAVRYGPAVMQATGQADGANPNQLQAKLAIAALAEHADQIDVPNVVLGFKVKNADLAKEQLIKLEMFGNMLEANEKMKGHFKKTKVGDTDYLVLSLDGEMIPWDEIPKDKFDALETEEGQIDKIVDKLKESKLVIAIGLRGNYLVASIGSTLECLEKLGQGKRLIDRDEFKPLAKFVDKRLVGIGYVSEDFNKQANNQASQIDDLVKAGDKLLPLAKLSEDKEEKIRKDVEALVKDVKSIIPEAGSIMGFSFLTDRGIETYQYAEGGHERIDGSKSLGLLQHVGGHPILGVVARAKVEPEIYEGTVKWLKVAYGYFEEFGMPNIPEKEREKAKKFLDAALPQLARLDKANREMLIPALADGQSAVVIDAKLQSKHFVEALPATEKPMPMLEPAIVMGVSDANLLKKGLGEYRTAINGLIDAARQVEGSQIPPEIQIPEPQTSEGPLGTIYSFPLPKEWGVDAKIVPNIGVSNEAFVISASKDHTERLLKATPLAVGGLLEKADRPLAVAFWLDWAALVEAASPWVDFGITQVAASKGVGQDQLQPVVQQVHTGLDVLKALRSVSSEYYLENDVLVQHTLTEIRDVSK